METNKSFIGYKKIIANILFLIIFAFALVNINQDFPYYYNGYFRLFTYIILSIITLFYIHNLVLLPILQQEKKLDKYKTYVFVISLIYVLFLLCLWFVNRENIEGSIFNPRGGTLIKTLSMLFVFISIPLIIAVVLSYAYSAIFLGKKVAYQFLELFVNFIVVILLYLLSFQDNTGFSVLLLTMLLIAFYSNTLWQMPKLLKQKNYKKYLFYCVLLLTTFNVFVLFFAYKSGFLTTNMMLLNFIFFIVFILSFVYGYVRIKIISKEKLFTLKLGAKDSELQLLKSQVNPHFLFNTLNTLYSTALEEKAEKTAESTAKLASLIRYMQEDINKDFIPLENEIKYLNDYINIQELRCAIKPNIDTEFVNIKNHNISPGLLIPFVENAFKYGIDPSKPSSLKVSVVCNDNTINFECVNSYKAEFKTYYKEQGFGIGIKNAKQRLELVYPKKHTFSISKQEELFSVNMSINTK